MTWWQALHLERLNAEANNCLSMMKFHHDEAARLTDNRRAHNYHVREMHRWNGKLEQVHAKIEARGNYEQRRIHASS